MRKADFCIHIDNLNRRLVGDTLNGWTVRWKTGVRGMEDSASKPTWMNIKLSINEQS